MSLPPPGGTCESWILTSESRCTGISSGWKRIRGLMEWRSWSRRESYIASTWDRKNYRAIYQIRDEVLLVLVVKVGDRKEVYRGVQ